MPRLTLTYTDAAEGPAAAADPSPAAAPVGGPEAGPDAGAAVPARHRLAAT